MLPATITVQFGIYCTATSSNSGLIALLQVVIITHYNACYVIKVLITFLYFAICKSSEYVIYFTLMV